MTTDRDCDATAFPTENQHWPECGLTKLQWAATHIAAAIATNLLAGGKDEQYIAEKATLIAVKVLEWSKP